MMMNVYISMIGPTATGKSAIALALCKRLSGEIVSCDSVQVYRDLHIGANKASTEERQQVPHHLIDIVSLDQTFTAGEEQDCTMEGSRWCANGKQVQS